jgi:hypothetical protein
MEKCESPNCNEIEESNTHKNKKKMEIEIEEVSPDYKS